MSRDSGQLCDLLTAVPRVTAAQRTSSGLALAQVRRGVRGESNLVLGQVAGTPDKSADPGPRRHDAMRSIPR
jgi:hypothetical protein